MEEIYVWYKPLGELDGKPYYHKTLVYTKDGSQNGDALSAGPEYSPTGSVINFDFGKIITENAKFDKNHIDHPRNIANIGKRPEWELVVSGDDLSSKWEDLKKNMKDINKEKHNYNPLYQNSNTAIDEALRRSNLPQPQKDSYDGDAWSPGSGIELPPNKKTGMTILTGRI